MAADVCTVLYMCGVLFIRVSSLCPLFHSRVNGVCSTDMLLCPPISREIWTLGSSLPSVCSLIANEAATSASSHSQLTITCSLPGKGASAAFFYMGFYEQLFDWSRKRGTLAADVSRKLFMNAAAPLSRNAGTLLRLTGRVENQRVLSQRCAA